MDKLVEKVFEKKTEVKAKEQAPAPLQQSPVKVVEKKQVVREEIVKVEETITIEKKPAVPKQSKGKKKAPKKEVEVKQ